MAGDPFEPELAAAAADAAEAAVMEAVDELLQLDLVRATDVPRRFRFRHPLVRRAVYESTAVGWRLGAHERCAEALAARGASGRSARPPRRALGASRATPTRSPSCARPARKRSGSRRQAPRTGSQTRCASSAERAGGGARRAPLRPCASADGGRPVRRQPRRPAGGARDRARAIPTCCAPGSPARVRGSRASSDGTSRPVVRLAGALGEPARPGLAGGGGAA